MDSEKGIEKYKSVRIFLPLLIIGAFMICSVQSALAQNEPVLFFSDLTWGPKTGWEGSTTKGAAITIWGENLGTTRGTSYITVNGAQLTSSTSYAEWGATGPARGLERITFWIPSTANDGAGTITVTVNGVTSNALPFTITSGTIYFVSVSGGSNTNNGQYSTAQGGNNGPWKDIYMFNPGLDSYSPSTNPSGDGQYIVYVRGGSYTTLDADSAFVALRGPYGGPTKQKALIAYPGETPILNTASASRGVIWNANYAPYGMNSYFTYSKLQVIGGTTGVDSYGNYNRIVGMTFKDMLDEAWSGVVMVDNSQQTRIYGNLFDHNGFDSYKHNVYIKTHAYAGSSEYTYLGWNEFSNAYASDTHGGAIFISKASDAGSKYTRYIWIHNNYFHDGNMEFIYTGDNTPLSDIYIYNNIFRGGSAIGGNGIFLAWDTNTVYLYNNVFYQMGGTGDAMIGLTGRTHAYFKNNIWVPRSGQAMLNIETYQGGTFSSDHDLFFGTAPSGGGITVTGAISGDPRFVSPSTYDFRLQSTSPAINAGTNTVSATVTNDYNGIPRPYGTGYDIGAHEYVSGTAPPTDTTPPTTPTNLQATPVSTTQINLVWTASTDPTPSSGLAGYRIYRCQGTGCTPTTEIATSTTNSYSNTGLTASTAYTYRVAAYDNAGNLGGQSASASATTQTTANQPPVLGTIGSKTVNEGSTLTITVSATDPNGDALTYSATGLPTGATFNPTTRTFTWTPTYTQAGTYTTTFTVTDGKGGTDTETITITVNNAVQQSTLTVGSGQGKPNDNVTILISLANIPNTSISGLNFNLPYDTTKLTFASATAGLAITNAGKSLSYNQPTPGDLRFVISGTNQNAIADGTLINTVFNIKPTAQLGDMLLALTNAAATNPQAQLVPLSLIGGKITVNSSTQDTTPPVLSNGQPTGSLQAGTTQTTMSATTNENANCKYSTAPNTAYASMPNTFTNTGTTAHTTTITGLQNGQTYNYYIRCQDATGNANTNDYTITFSVSSTQTASQGPYILFTDVESGPATGGPNNNGVPISIFGKGFGATRGTSKVTIGGVEVASYLVWGQNNAHNPTLDMIVVQPGPSITGGAIQVTVNGKASNSDKTFSVNSAGRVFFIATSGADSNACSQTTPCSSVLHVATNVMSPGDTVLIRGGSYTESEVWIQGGDSGSLGRQKVIKNYPGEEVYLTNSARSYIIDANYITISGLNFKNGKSLSLSSNDKAVNNAFDGNIQWDAIDSHGNDVTIAGNTCNIGTSSVGTQGHCYYITAGSNLNILYNTASGPPGYGIHIFDQERGDRVRRVIKNVLIEGNLLKKSTQRSGLLLEIYDEAGLGNNIDNVTIRNNIFTANNLIGLAIQATSGGKTSNIKVYQNTFYQNGLQGITVDNTANVNNVEIRNNLIYQADDSNCNKNDPDNSCTWYPVTPIQIGTSVQNLVINNNYYYPAVSILDQNGNAVNSRDANAVTGAVQFSNAAALDFHTMSGSATIDRGASLPAVARDYDGISRPQGTAYDIGAYEYIGGTTPGTPTVTITTPASGATVSGTITITATATGSNGIAGVQFKIDGQNLGTEDTTQPYSTSWNTAQTTNGQHTITATARDTAGVTGSNSIPVTVNNQLTCAQQQGYTCLPEQFCSGTEITATDTATCCSQACQTPQNTYCSQCGSGLFNLCDKTECYLITEQCYFIPQLLNNQCLSCQAATCSSYKDQATCQENNCKIPNCAWNGSSCAAQMVISAGASISVGSGQGNPGSNVVIPVNLANGAGTSTSGLNFDLIYDSSKITFNGIVAGQVVTNAGKSLSTSSPAAGTLRVVIMGLNQNAIASGKLADVTLGIKTTATAGITPLTLSNAAASDPQANSIILTLNNGGITVNQPADTTPPTVTITTPTSNPTYTSTTQTVNLGGTSTDDNTGVAQITWANNMGGGGTATGTTAWTANGITLQSGQNIITVTARDGANNTATDTITVTYNAADTTPPTTPTNLQATATSTTQINLAWTASTDPTPSSGLAGYKIYRCQGTTCTPTQIANSTTNTYSDTGLTPATKYTYKTAAYDNAGNTGTQSLPTTATTQTGQQTSNATPVLFFSDLTWGPKTGWEGSTTKGAAITIWGKNLGTTRGTSYITVNGAQLTSSIDYAEWGTTGTTNGVARGLERVTFWLNSNCQDGAGTITVTVNGVTSNALPFTITSGTIYFVSVSGGSNSNNGLYSTAQGGNNGPFRDIWKFNPCGPNDNAHSAGSCNPSQDGQYIVYVRGGTYTTMDTTGEGYFVGLRGPYGGPTKQKALIAYPGEVPTLNMAGGERGAIWNAEYSPYRQNSYFTYSKLRMTGGGGDGIASYGNYNRIVGNTFQNIRPGSQFQSGTVFGSSSDHMYIYGNYWDNTGYDSYGHAIYIKTQPGSSGDPQTAQNVYIGWNEISNPYAVDVHGGSIFLSKSSDSDSTYTNHIYIHDNYFHDGSESDFVYADDGQRIEYVWIWNNIFTGGLSGANTESALFLTFGDLRHFYVYNNVFYNTASTDQYSNGVVAIVNDNRKQDIRFANNIFVANANPSQGFIYLDSLTLGISTISSSNDLYYSPTGVSLPTLGGGRTNSVVGDPKFTNAASRDFTLQSSSPARDRGTSTLVGDANSDIPIGTRDYNGAIRGSSYDIGAYEYAPGTPPPIDTTPPTVSVTSPANGATVSGTITITATATDDNSGVAGVQFKIDGQNLGTEDTTTPYTTSWNTTQTTNGQHTITATARDTAANQQTSNGISTTVNNPTADTTPPTTPTGLTATAVSSSQINLAWTASTDPTPSSGLAGYKIYRCQGTTCTPTQIDNTTTNTYTNTGLTPSTTYTYKTAAYDNAGNTGTQSLPTTATTQQTANQPPVLGTIGSKTVNEGSTLTITLSATDADGDTLTYSATGVPTGATFTTSTKTFSWTPAYTQAGTYTTTFTVTDGKGGTDTETITITVNNVNRLPVLNAIGNKTTNEGTTLTITATATDPDGDTLTYSTTGVPTGATFNPTTRTFTWTPTYTQAGTYTTTFTVTDGKGGTDTETITITVNNVIQTCAAQTGDICLDTEICPGTSLTASDTTRCCSQQCALPSWNLCSQCGSGLFNVCDKDECNSITEICYFTPGVLVNNCNTCSSASCESYADQATCVEDHCGFANCNWQGNSCITVLDTTPPTLSNGQPTGNLQAGTTQTTMSATTNENANCKYSTTANTAYASIPNNFTNTGTTTHTTTITGLQNGQTYNYHIRCQDTAGNANTNDYTITFTISQPADTTPPTTPTNLQATPRSSTQIDLTWTASTDPTPSSGLAGYKIYRCQGTTCTPSNNISTTTTNSYADTGLTASSTYRYRVSAYDTAGNAGNMSSIATAITLSQPDTTPPVISSINEIVTNNQATISWVTDETADSEILYGTTTSYGQQASDNNNVTSHSVILTNLNPSTTYHYKIRSKDLSNNQAESQDRTFATQAMPTIAATLTATPSQGDIPLTIDLTGTSAGTAQGSTTYTFYCNREDTTTDITPDYAAQYTTPQTTRTVNNACTYNTTGTYTAKVITERSGYKAEARTTITATQQGVLDEDQDGVLDTKDKCIGTPAGTTVKGNGCPVLARNYTEIGFSTDLNDENLDPTHIPSGFVISHTETEDEIEFLQVTDLLTSTHTLPDFESVFYFGPNLVIVDTTGMPQLGNSPARLTLGITKEIDPSLVNSPQNKLYVKRDGARCSQCTIESVERYTNITTDVGKKPLRVRPGTTVTWSNNGSSEHVISSSLFNTAVQPGEAYSYIFTQTGQYDMNVGSETSTVTVTDQGAATTDLIKVRFTTPGFSEFSIGQEQDTTQEGGTSGGSGGGGGARGITRLDEATTIVSANAGDIKTFVYTKNTDIKTVTVDFAKKVGSTTITVEKRTQNLQNIPTPEGLVYAYEQITTNLGQGSYERALITFKIPKEWAQKNRVQPYEIKVKQYTTGWEDLPTTKIDTDNTYYYYETETKNLAYLAIVAEKKAGTTQGETAGTEEEAPVTETPPEEEKKGEAVTEKVQPKKTKGYLLAIIVVLAVIALIFVLSRLVRRKKPTKVDKTTEAKIVEFYKEKLKQGYTKEHVIQAAKKAGWKEETIKQILKK